MRLCRPGFPPAGAGVHPGYSNQFPIRVSTSAVGQQSSLSPFAF